MRCPACGRQVLDEAKHCGHCGRPLRRRRTSVRSALLIAAAALLGVAVLFSLRPGARPAVGWPERLDDTAPPEGVPESSFRVSPADGMPQVLIPAGEVTMGSPAEQDGRRDEEGPQKRVSVSAFWMDLHEVTNEQYCRFVNDRCPNDRERKEWIDLVGEFDSDLLSPEIEQRDGAYVVVAGRGSHPVVYVTWHGAAAYAEWAGRKLPTEAQWERAARGDREGWKYVWGDSDRPPDGAGNLSDERLVARWPGWRKTDRHFPDYDDGYVTTAPVCRFRAGPFGLYDMAGNVWEWCRDAHDEDWYARMPAKQPVNTTQGRERVVRGGSWFNFPRYQRVAYRRGLMPALRDLNLGFRCVEAPDPSPR